MPRNFIAYDKAKVFYQSCTRLKLPDYLYDQLVRASSSVAMNLAEGSGKSTPKDQKRYYSMALGSIRECEAILDLANVADPELKRVLDEVAAITVRLVGFRKRQTSPEP